jgi:hypothetical protein
MYTMNYPVHGIRIALVYVDAVIHIVPDFLKWIESVKWAVGEEFRMTNFGEAKRILGMGIMNNREAGTDSLSHEQHTKEILD